MVRAGRLVLALRPPPVGATTGVPEADGQLVTPGVVERWQDGVVEDVRRWRSGAAGEGLAKYEFLVQFAAGAGPAGSKPAKIWLGPDSVCLRRLGLQRSQPTYRVLESEALMVDRKCRAAVDGEAPPPPDDPDEELQEVIARSKNDFGRVPKPSATGRTRIGRASAPAAAAAPTRAAATGLVAMVLAVGALEMLPVDVFDGLTLDSKATLAAKLIGREVAKRFDGHGVFTGTVIKCARWLGCPIATAVRPVAGRC